MNLKRSNLSMPSLKLSRFLPYLQICNPIPPPKPIKTNRSTVSLTKFKTLRVLDHTNRKIEVQTTRTNLDMNKSSLEKSFLSQRHLKELHQELLGMKSDYIELKRDLSTYEYSVGSFTDLPKQLNKICAIQDSLSLKVPKFSTNDLKTTIEEGLSALLSVNSNAKKRTVFRAEHRSTENWQVKTQLLYKISHSVIQCVRKISGIPCVINVSSNPFFSNFVIKVLTQTKNVFVLNLPLQVKNEQEIHSRIIPFLYITIEKGVWGLAWALNYRKDFLNLCIDFPMNKLLQLTETSQSVIIKFLETNDMVKVSRRQVVGTNSIFDTSDHSLIRTIGRHLYCHENFTAWHEQPMKRHYKKEKKSNFMKDSFLSERFSKLYFEANVLVDGTTYKIDIFRAFTKELIQVSRGSTKMKVHMNSDIGQLLKGMQFTYCSESPLTMIRSLEFAHVIRLLFE